jgi:hypothetical protein
MSENCDNPAVQPPEIEETVAVRLGQELRKARRRNDSKASIARSKPLPVGKERSTEAASDRQFRAAWWTTAGDLSEADQHKAVLQALEVFRTLPPTSTYAQHRIKVLEKALELLDKAAR